MMYSRLGRLLATANFRTQAEATLPMRMQFIRKVYAILTVQLLFTTALSAVSFFSKPYKNWIQNHQWMMWISLFGAIGFMLLTFWKRKSYPTNLVFLAGFTGLEAYSISVITSVKENPCQGRPVRYLLTFLRSFTTRASSCKP